MTAARRPDRDGATVLTLHSTWRLPAPPDRTWDVLADPTSWPLWWKGLRSTVVRQGAHDGVGTRGSLAYLAPGYVIRVGLEVVAALPPGAGRGGCGGVVLRAVGDLRGRALAVLRPDEAAGAEVTTATVLTIDWRVRPTGALLRRAALRAPRVLEASHAVVMDRGERGLRAHLTATRSWGSLGR
ncbi:SRPBCC family protein [Miniimonas sp. S16]|uniref:SRPBCC family protein n=1 Tax=Miniimonas sp. S16 TaxID=2171623 RepID=UPI000D529A13|nr:SRPBCC family protein [Miniimonas sp. S16]